MKEFDVSELGCIAYEYQDKGNTVFEMVPVSDLIPCNVGNPNYSSQEISTETFNTATQCIEIDNFRRLLSNSIPYYLCINSNDLDEYRKNKEFMMTYFAFIFNHYFLTSRLVKDLTVSICKDLNEFLKKIECAITETINTEENADE